METRSVIGPAGAPSRKTLLGRPIVWVLFAVIILATLGRSMFRSEDVPPAPVLRELPDYVLVNSRGEGFGSEDLRGTVYLANFVFTRCASYCPALMHSLGQLDARLQAEGVNGVRLVSFSVDPEHDTPERLREYAKAQGVDTERWTLLTGEPEIVKRLLLEEFQVMMGEPELVGDLIDVAHSGKLALVDRKGAIRGYYNHDGPGLDGAFRRARELTRERD